MAGDIDHLGRPRWWPWAIAIVLALVVAARLIMAHMEERTEAMVLQYAASPYRVEPISGASVDFPSRLYVEEFTRPGDGGYYLYTELLANRGRPVGMRFDYARCSPCALEHQPVISAGARLYWADPNARGGTVVHYVETLGEHLFRERVVAVSNGYRFEVSATATEVSDLNRADVRQFFDSFRVP